MKKYFKGIANMEELKKEYKRLAKKLHPDLGGSNEEFQELLKEYELCLKEGFINSTDKEITAEMWQVINRFMFDEDIIIEITGSWVWISGKTFDFKDSLKELGAKWSGKHKKWYYAETVEKKRATKGNFEDIKEKYGYNKIKTEKKVYL